MSSEAGFGNDLLLHAVTPASSAKHDSTDSLRGCRGNRHPKTGQGIVIIEGHVHPVLLEHAAQLRV